MTISSTHHNNRSVPNVCLYIQSVSDIMVTTQALRQLFKRHGNYMKLEYGTARSKRPHATLKANST